MDLATFKSFLPVLTGIFGAGVAWGLMKASAKTQEERINKIAASFEASLNKLADLVTDFKVMRAEHSVNLSDIKELQGRMSVVELTLAALKATKRRTR